MNKNLISFNPGKWVDNYADALYAYTMARVKDMQLAEDIVQDTFFNAFKAKHTYKGQASEKNWLYAILKNKIVDHYRKHGNNNIILATGEDQMYFEENGHWKEDAGPAEWTGHTGLTADTKEFYSVLDKCKQKLNEIQQAVFVMKYMEDIEAGEICKILNITPSNYWVLIHRAKLHLRKCLEKNWIGIG